MLDEYRPFVVDEVPYCIYDANIKERNVEFLSSIDPDYFSHIANIHASHLDGDQRKYAAVALRTEYYHGLEVLFAFICATVQDPYCIVGWLLKYKNSDLTSVVQKLNKGQKVRHRLNLEHITWDAIAARINNVNTGDEEADNRLRQSFGQLWKNFAKDFLDDDAKNEYNSIKHGLRVSMGGFSLAMGLESVPGVPSETETMRLIEGSTYGTSFFVPAPLKNRDNFHLLHHTLNWNPVNFVHGLNLISISIHNIMVYLKQVNGIQHSEIEFRGPISETDFASPWRLLANVNRVSIKQEIDRNSLVVLSKTEILSYLDGNSYESPP